MAAPGSRRSTAGRASTSGRSSPTCWPSEPAGVPVARPAASSSRRRSAGSSRRASPTPRRGLDRWCVVSRRHPRRHRARRRAARCCYGDLNMDIVILIVAFLIILLGAELFTNGIEWFGRKLELAEGAVGSVLAAVGTALPETMIPIIAILFATRRGVARGRGRRDPRRPVHARDAGDVRDRRRGPRGRRGGARPATTMQVDTEVLAHDMRYFAIAYALAIGAAFLPLEPVWLKWIVAVGPDRHLRLVRQGPLRGRRRTSTPRTSRRCASTASTAARIATDPARPAAAGRQPPGPRRARPDHPRGRLLRRCGRAPRQPRSASTRRCSRWSSPDRDRAAREVQLDHLGPPGQGHPGDGQHHRRDGLPVDDPDGRRAPLRVERVGHRGPGTLRRLRVGRHRVPLVGGHLHPDGPVAACCAAGACSSAASSTWPTSRS